MIRKLDKNDLKEILLLNEKYKKECRSKKQEFLFTNCNSEYNCSYGIFVDEKLEEYLIAFKNNTYNHISIDTFMWKKSKGYLEMMDILFQENDGFEYDMYVCDKGLNIFLRIIDRYFSNEYYFNFICTVKEEKYNEVLNHISFLIKRKQEIRLSSSTG